MRIRASLVQQIATATLPTAKAFDELPSGRKQANHEGGLHSRVIVFRTHQAKIMPNTCLKGRSGRRSRRSWRYGRRSVKPSAQNSGRDLQRAIGDLDVGSYDVGSRHTVRDVLVAMSLLVYVVVFDAAGEEAELGESLAAGFESWRTEIWGRSGSVRWVPSSSHGLRLATL